MQRACREPDRDTAIRGKFLAHRRRRTCVRAWVEHFAPAEFLLRSEVGELGDARVGVFALWAGGPSSGRQLLDRVIRGL